MLFSADFVEMSGLFLWRVIGDFLKISSWLIAFLMHAKAMTKLFIITEISFTIFYVIIAFLLGNIIGLQGIVLGYAINYAVYFIAVFILLYKKFVNKYA